MNRRIRSLTHYPILLTLETQPQPEPTAAPVAENNSAEPTEAAELHPNIDAVLKMLENPAQPAPSADKPTDLPDTSTPIAASQPMNHPKIRKEVDDEVQHVDHHKRR